MLDKLNSIKSTRVFLDKPIEDETKLKILQTATSAPTAGNMMMYAMIDVTDQHIKEELSESCDHQPFIKSAPMVVVFCADNYRFNTGAKHFYKHDLRNPLAGDFMLAVSDTLILAHHAVLAAHSLGVGSCYIGDILENFEHHQELLHLPEHVIPIAMVVFGYATQQQMDRDKPKRFDVSFVLHQNMYQEKPISEHVLAIENRNKQMNLQHIKASDYYKDYASRKYESDFMAEMNRSVVEIIKRYNQYANFQIKV